MAINRWGLIRDIDNGQDWRAEEHVQFTPLSQVAPQGRPNRINYMKNQRQHGACTGFMRTRLQRMALQKAGLVDVDLSELHAYWWNRVYSGLNPNLDTGASIRGSLDAGRAKGACREAWWTYANADGYLNVKPEAYADEDALNYQILESYTLPNNPDAIMQALNDGFGVGLGASVFEEAFEMSFVNTGHIVMPQNTDKVVGAHAFVLDGWDKQVAAGEWDMANSWGPLGPMQGFGRITFDYITKYAFDIWAVRANESPVPTPNVAEAILGHSFGASQTVPDVTTVDMKQGNTVIRVWPRAQGASPAAQAHAALHASTGRGSEDDTLP
jgi:hypothetical protein